MPSMATTDGLGPSVVGSKEHDWPSAIFKDAQFGSAVDHNGTFSAVLVFDLEVDDELRT